MYFLNLNWYQFFRKANNTSHSNHINTGHLKMFGKDDKLCLRWRGDRVALYQNSFEYDFSGENVFVTFLKRSLYLSEILNLRKILSSLRKSGREVTCDHTLYLP